jgi:hypothetical protein
MEIGITVAFCNEFARHDRLGGLIHEYELVA